MKRIPRKTQLEIYHFMMLPKIEQERIIKRNNEAMGIYDVEYSFDDDKFKRIDDGESIIKNVNAEDA